MIYNKIVYDLSVMIKRVKHAYPCKGRGHPHPSLHSSIDPLGVLTPIFEMEVYEIKCL